MIPQRIAIQDARVTKGNGATDTLKFAITANQLADSIGIVLFNNG